MNRKLSFFLIFSTLVVNAWAVEFSAESGISLLESMQKDYDKYCQIQRPDAAAEKTSESIIARIKKLLPEVTATLSEKEQWQDQDRFLKMAAEVESKNLRETALIKRNELDQAVAQLELTQRPKKGSVPIKLEIAKARIKVKRLKQEWDSLKLKVQDLESGLAKASSQTLESLEIKRNDEIKKLEQVKILARGLTQLQSRSYSCHAVSVGNTQLYGETQPVATPTPAPIGQPPAITPTPPQQATQPQMNPGNNSTFNNNSNGGNNQLNQGGAGQTF